jgi:hypothetical protein
MLLQFRPATRAHTVKRFVDDDFAPAEQWRSRPDGQFLCNPPTQVAVLFQLPREGSPSADPVRGSCQRSCPAMNDILCSALRSASELAGHWKALEDAPCRVASNRLCCRNGYLTVKRRGPYCGGGPGSWSGETGHGQPASQCECEAFPSAYGVSEIAGYKYAAYVIHVAGAEHTAESTVEGQPLPLSLLQR